MSIEIVPARKLRSKAWAERYPEKAEDLWVIARRGGAKNRVRIGPPTPENQLAAEKKVAEWKALAERKTLVDAGIVVQSFSEAAEEWLRRGLRQRAPKTISGRRIQVGILARHFGPTPLDRIGALEIAKWWELAIDGQRRTRTGKGYLNVLSMVFKYAARSTPDLVNPVPAARIAIFEDIEQTAESRSANQANCNPLTADELTRLLPQIEATGNPDLLLTVLLCYECGLRIGEALGLQWGDVWTGRDESDTSRHVHVQRSRGDGAVGLTKSGLTRKVGMSRRLRSHLQARFMEQGRPDDGAWVIHQSWTKNIRLRLHRCCKAAKIRPVKLKDLRDTYASTLVTHGIVFKWVSLQLGHASVKTTEDHYAAYMAMDGYRNPWMVPDGGLPSDLFAQLDGWISGGGHHRAHTGTEDKKAK